MPDKEHVLSPSAAQAYYDRFGAKQDTQGFYEDPAHNDILANADFEEASSVFEFGCGTGKLATRLLEKYLSPSATYLGYDISPAMIELVRHRLAVYGERAQAQLSDGAIRFPSQDHSVDRIVSTYVLDLLSESDIRRFFLEAQRVLVPHGYLCLASLTRGVTLPSRLVSSLWMRIFRLNPATVGGCRPVRLDDFVNPQEWQVVHKSIVTPFGVPSEVLILASRGTDNNGL
jgi:ubiquinone/menaquinone biosynthesis C-methylase UbiE